MGTFEGANEAQIEQMVEMVAVDMEAGGMGISHGAYYNPGCTYEEMIATAKEAARHGGMAASHIRDNLFNLKSLIPFFTYYLNKEFLAEAIRTAQEADIPYIVSHLTDVTYEPDTTRYALDSILRAMNHDPGPTASLTTSSRSRVTGPFRSTYSWPWLMWSRTTSRCSTMW